MNCQVSRLLSQGCCKVESPFSNEKNEGSLEMIGEIASGVSHIGFSLSGKESKNDIVEDSQHFWRVAHTTLCVIFLHGDISSMVQTILNSPMTSG